MINSSQEQQWLRSIEIFEDGEREPRTVALLAQTELSLAQAEVPRLKDGQVVRILVSQMELRRPRQWGACWLAIEIYEMRGLVRVDFQAEFAEALLL